MSNLSPSGPGDVEKPSLAEPLRPVLVVVGLLALMWIVEIIDLLPGTDIDGWGIRPRTLRGSFGIPVAAFLHAGLGHLIANSVAFLVLGTFIAIGNLTRYLQVTLIVAVTSGLGTWLFGAPGTIHLGASGLVFGYLTYLLARGFFAGRITWILGGVVVALLYGWILWGLLPRPGVSWTGHAFGAVGGVLAAWWIHGREPDDSDLPNGPTGPTGR
ncbi:MAG: rhomboid family intramembrane serine protease [Ilumatobacteraceae bacterium]